MKTQSNAQEQHPIDNSKHTLRCPHCDGPVPNKLAMRSSRSEPMTCKQCESPSWFKEPNGLPFLTIFLTVGVTSVPEALKWPSVVQWTFIAIGIPLVLILHAYMTWRFGHMVKLPVHPIRKFRPEL